MGKIQMVLAGVFLGGVLLGGIGAGIAIVEYSSMAYAGEKKIGEENLVTCEMDYTFAPEKERICIEDYGYWNTGIEEDETVPEGTIRYEVTYNEKTVKPILRIRGDLETTEESFPEESFDTEEGETQGEAVSDSQEDLTESQTPQKKKQTILELGVHYTYNDFAILMESKEEILADLKQGRIASYDVVYISQVRIKVNPRTMSCIDKDRVIAFDY